MEPKPGKLPSVVTDKGKSAKKEGQEQPNIKERRLDHVHKRAFTPRRRRNGVDRLSMRGAAEKAEIITADAIQVPPAVQQPQEDPGTPATERRKRMQIAKPRTEAVRYRIGKELAASPATIREQPSGLTQVAGTDHRETAAKPHFTVKPREMLSFDQVLEKEDTTPERLDGKLRDRFAQISKSDIEDQDQALDLISTIYHLYRHSEDPSLKGTAMPGIHSVDELLDTYAPDISNMAKLRFKRDFSLFVTEYVHPQRFIDPFEYQDTGDTIQIYDTAEPSWVPLQQTNNYFRPPTAIGSSIIPDMRKIAAKPDPYPRPRRYYHQTTARALDKILQQGAIFSAAQIRNNGQIPQGGAYELEQMFAPEEEARHAVYASNKPGLDPYAVLAWFDDSAVSLRIDFEKQLQFFQDSGIDTTPWNYGRDVEPTNGMMLGPVVPISSVDEISVWERDKDSLQAKVQRSHPEFEVLSLEAVVAMHNYKYNTVPLVGV